MSGTIKGNACELSVTLNIVLVAILALLGYLPQRDFALWNEHVLLGHVTQRNRQLVIEVDHWGHWYWCSHQGFNHSVISLRHMHLYREC